MPRPQWTPCFVQQVQSPEWKGPTSQLQYEDKVTAPASCLRRLLSKQGREHSVAQAPRKLIKIGRAHV